ncbi:MAG: ComF family protein [Lactobacillales bacterium]|jgi:competence protein ComFC|nr:ComF family protein [Lactobacillales bacterium]
MTCLLCYKQQTKKLLISEFWFFHTPKVICATCLSKFEKVGKQICRCCSKACTVKLCDDCRRWQKLYPGYQFKNESLYFYNEAMEEFMQRYKFHGDYRLRFVFAKRIANKLRKYKGWIIIPISISSERFLLRGFNQVEGLLLASNIRFCSALIKPVDRAYQSHKTKKERLQESQPFLLTEEARSKLCHKKILLVDDIYTTGRTLFHAYDAIKKACPKKVQTFTLAR